MSRGVGFNDGSLMLEPYELRRVAPDLRREAALIAAAQSTRGNEMPSRRALSGFDGVVAERTSCEAVRRPHGRTLAPAT